MRIVEFCKKEIASILDEVMEFWFTKAIDLNQEKPIYVPKVNMCKSPYHILLECVYYN